MTFSGAPDGKHYWITPPDLFKKLDDEFHFTFDPAPYPKPKDFNGLIADWGESNYVNPPFGGYIGEDGKKYGPTIWARKVIEESKKGKRIVYVYPLDKWVLMLIQSASEIRDLGDIKWQSIEDKNAHKGVGRHIACFIFKGEK